jgi:hypothetical protein
MMCHAATALVASKAAASARIVQFDCLSPVALGNGFRVMEWKLLRKQAFAHPFFLASAMPEKRELGSRTGSSPMKTRY